MLIPKQKLKEKVKYAKAMVKGYVKTLKPLSKESKLARTANNDYKKSIDAEFGLKRKGGAVKSKKK